MTMHHAKSYTGGKAQNGVLHTLINLIPPHKVYIEPFLGNGAILRNKRPAAVNIGIDRDRAALQLFENCSIAENGESLVFIEGNALELLESFSLPPDTFIFIDAPYLQTSRRTQGNLYKFEFKTEPEHEKLLKLAKSLSAKILITHYKNDFYFDQLADWNFHEFFSYDRGGNKRKEIAFFNYPKPAQLHDYRFLGANFREREKITRQQKRWKRRLEEMSLLQRQAMLSVIEETFLIQGSYR